MKRSSFCLVDETPECNIGSLPNRVSVSYPVTSPVLPCSYRAIRTRLANPALVIPATVSPSLNMMTNDHQKSLENKAFLVFQKGRSSPSFPACSNSLLDFFPFLEAFFDSLSASSASSFLET